MAINKVIYKNTTLIDLTGDTVESVNLEDGITAHAANGEPIVGSMINTGKGEYIWRKHAIYQNWVITKTSLGTTKPSDCASTRYNSYTITEDGYFSLSGTSYLGGYYYISGQSANKSIYREQWSPSINGSSSTTTYYLWTLPDEIPEKEKGDFLGYVSSDDVNAYPTDGIQDGYWYVKYNSGESSVGVQKKEGSIVIESQCESFTIDTGLATVHTIIVQASGGSVSNTYSWMYDNGGRSLNGHAYRSQYLTSHSTSSKIDINGGIVTCKQDSSSYPIVAKTFNWVAYGE